MKLKKSRLRNMDQRSQMASNNGKPPLGYLNNGHKFSSSNLDEVSIAESHTPGGARKGMHMRHNIG